jgi:hypothetical protein
MTSFPTERIAAPTLTGEAGVPVAESRLAALLRSPRKLAALAVLYALLPVFVTNGGDTAARLCILAASGALLGAIPALLIARRVARRFWAATFLLGGLAGALLFSGGVSAALGDAIGAHEMLSWSLLFPAFSYAACVTLLLVALSSAERDRASLPTATALGLAVFGIVPLVNALSTTRGALWFPQVSVYWFIGGGGLTLIILGVVRWLPEQVDQFTHDVVDRVMGVPAPLFLGVVALIAFVGSAALAVLCFARQPHNADEVAQLWHARILLAGRLSLPVDANPEFFGMDNVIDRGRWYSQFPIGGPAFLALGLALRAAWLVNPLLLALTVPNLYAFARRTYDEATARASVLLLAFSPMVLFMGASYMNHMAVLWLVSVALAQLAIWVDAEQRADASRAAAIIGLALGVAAAIRPLDAAIAALVIGCMQLGYLRRSRARLESLAAQVLAGAIPVALLLWANARTTGAPLLFGYDVLYGSAHQLGFHEDPYGMMHTPIRALMYASKYLLQLDVMLLEAPAPALGIIIMGLLVLRRPSRWDLLLIGYFLAQLVLYALYWHEGDFRGPRFLFTALPAILILLARAPGLVASATRGTVRRTALVVLPVFVVAGWGTYGNAFSVMGRVRGYRSVSSVGRVEPDSLAHAAGLHHALVFVREGSYTGWQRRLWALGVPRSETMRLMASVHPCALRQAVIEEEGMSAPTTERLDRILHTISRFGPRAQAAPACVAELVADNDGLATYAQFLPANTIGRDGRIGGDVVYVLDLGSHNEVLRARFGDRTWYTFGPHRSRGEIDATLTPYAYEVSAR